MAQNIQNSINEEELKIKNIEELSIIEKNKNTNKDLDIKINYEKRSKNNK
jgi:hypothetical protein